MRGVRAVRSSFIEQQRHTQCRHNRLPQQNSQLLPTSAVAPCAGGGLERHAIDTTVAMLSYSHVANALHLADHEFRDLNLPTDWPFLESLGA